MTTQRITVCASLAALCIYGACLPLCGLADTAAQVPATTAPSTGSVEPRDPRPHLAVVGFEAGQGADPRDAWMPAAVEETLAWRLRRVPGLVAVPTVRLYQARRELQEEDSPLPEWPRVVSALGAELMITGQCSGPPEGVALRLALYELGPEPKLRAESEFPPGRILEIFDAPTRWALERLGLSDLPRAAERLVFSPAARSPSTLQYYARALLAARAENFKDAGYCALQALDYDERYRPALAMIAQLELQRGGTGLLVAGARLRAAGDWAQLQDDPQDWAAAELGQGVVAQLSGEFNAAYTRFETSLALSYEQDSPYGQLAAMNSLCDLYLARSYPRAVEPTDDQRQRFERQNFLRAAEWQEVGLSLLRQLGDVVAEAPAANKLALTYERLGDRDRALVMHQRALAAAERTGCRRNQATAWLYVGQWYQREQRWDEAVAAMQRCLELSAEGMKPVARLALAGVYQGQGATAEALEQYEQAYEKLRAGRDLTSQFLCLRQIAELRKQLGRREAAYAALQEAIDLAHALERPEEAALRDKLAEWKSEKP